MEKMLDFLPVFFSTHLMRRPAVYIRRIMASSMLVHVMGTVWESCNKSTYSCANMAAEESDEGVEEGKGLTGLSLLPKFYLTSWLLCKPWQDPFVRQSYRVREFRYLRAQFEDDTLRPGEVPELLAESGCAYNEKDFVRFKDELKFTCCYHEAGFIIRDSLGLVEYFTVYFVINN